MHLLGRRLLVVLVPLVFCIPLLLSLPDIAAAAPDCRRTLASYPALDPGDRGPAVRTLQCVMNDLGLEPVVVDGYYGPQTKNALTPVVMGREGQPPHPYRLTSLFWHQLFGLQLPDHTTLREGDHGRDVRTLQRALRAYGIDVVIDADFGPQTTIAVKAYQERHRLAQTGRTDRDTRFYLSGGDYY